MVLAGSCPVTVAALCALLSITAITAFTALVLWLERVADKKDKSQRSQRSRAWRQRDVARRIHAEQNRAGLLAGLSLTEKPKEPPMETPSIGRIVHYTPASSEPVYGQPNLCLSLPEPFYAAIITKVYGGDFVAVRIFDVDDGRLHSRFEVAHTLAAAGSEEARGKWCWPARV